MSVRVLGGADVEELLDVEGCVAAVRRAQVELSAGRAVQPPRVALRLPGGVEQLIMPACLDGVAVVKSITVAPANAARGLPRLLGSALLLDAATGAALALIDAAALTLARTAAASAVATDALARPDAAVLAVVGTGPQAAAHVAAMCAVRPIAEVRIAGRTAAAARRCADALRRAHPRLAVVAAPSARAAVAGAGGVCTVTSSPAPVVAGGWLSGGCHVNAVGAHHPTARELDGETMRRARVVVDSRAAALTESGDCLLPIEDGVYDAGHVSTEIGEVLAGARPGRRSPDEVTVYVSVGLAVQDAAVARLAYERAVARGRGAVVEA